MGERAFLIGAIVFGIVLPLGFITAGLVLIFAVR